MGITVGFDLDMTLIDSRPGMLVAMNRLGEESGLPLDGVHFAANLGPPLDDSLRGYGAPEERIPELITRFRGFYPDVVVPVTLALPGAAAALRAVRQAGGRTLVVTGKYGPNAQLHVDALGLEVDELVGEQWSTGKAVSLLEHGAVAYVGDHRGDIRGAKAAGALAVGVTTGPCSRAELEAEGADVVFDSLEEFPDWFASVPPASPPPRSMEALRARSSSYGELRGPAR
ncbi:HAD family hydrolase [Amycolatopsis sp. H20-H5]|uniref:HAD family hydrolase n=1 Tax=Amycolatopsis sp. H20-H5 TaxID=3046309 RepID=UPI002DBF554B|nr:haloacid dehalogenase-like hydrolase [Amycolatopsis sp. H20-H5]MEC3978587.1 haloacid dehalogenase-like hydrolase [Amycolatopsis sp. H20-H5]